MSRTIWKYKLRVADSQEVEMPAGAKVLCAQMQRDDLCIWALVNPESPPGIKTIRIAGTGHKLPIDPGRYVGTFQMHEGSLVFHVFEQ